MARPPSYPRRSWKELKKWLSVGRKQSKSDKTALSSMAPIPSDGDHNMAASTATHEETTTGVITKLDDSGEQEVPANIGEEFGIAMDETTATPNIGAGQNTPAPIGTHDAATADTTTMPKDTVPASNKERESLLNSLHCPERTPCWAHTLDQWRQNDPSGFHAFSKAASILKEPLKVVEQFHMIERDLATPGSTATKERIKRFQPTLAAIRGIAMAAANWDPNKIAPIVCAVFFFSIDILLNNMNENDRDKILDIMLNCHNTIAECVWFEKYFTLHTTSSHSNIKTLAVEVQEGLGDQYLQILKLISDIQLSCTSDKVSKFLDGLTNKVASWEGRNKEIAQRFGAWNIKKQNLDKELSQITQTKKVRDWIKKEDDNELGLDAIKATIMPDGNYSDAAQWFLSRQEFQAWCNNFRKPQNPADEKRCLWLKGTYGTGKTTIVYHAYSCLKKERGTALESGTLRIVPYFCNASVRPGYETVLRGLIWHMSWLPGSYLAPTVQARYNEAQGSKSEQLHTKSWEDLFLRLLEERKGDDQFVFIVDALDECLDTEDSDLFLEFMATKVMQRFSNVHLLCSSHPPIPVGLWFSDSDRSTVEVNANVTGNDMNTFIVGELKRSLARSRGSVFGDPAEGALLEDLMRQLLRHAQGMFRWVQIWLEICLPLDSTKIIRRRRDADQLLIHLQNDVVTHESSHYDLLSSGYQRLWDRNCLRGFKDQRILLYRLMLATFEPLTLDNLKDALAIQNRDFDGNLKAETVERLCSNFLQYKDDGSGENKTMRWVHASARDFIVKMTVQKARRGQSKEGEKAERGGQERDPPLEFTERENNRAVAELFLDVVGFSSHPLWKCHIMRNINLRDWIHFQNGQLTGPKNYLLKHSLQRWKDETFLGYLVNFGLKHCSLAAEKPSIFDPIWARVLHEVVLEPESAFGFTLLLEGYADARDWNCCRFRSIFPSAPTGFQYGQVAWSLLNEGIDGAGFSLLHSHVLARLNIIQEDDLTHKSLVSSQSLLKRLFEHSAHIGGDFINEQNARPRPMTALQIAIAMGNVAAIDMILQIRKALFNDDSETLNKASDYTPLSYAAKLGDVAVVALLLQQDNIVVDGRGAGGYTALMLAASNDQKTTVELLLGQRNVNVSLQNNKGDTALMLAARVGSEAVVKLLFDERIANMQNKKGRTLLMVAAKAGHKAVIKLLLGQSNVSVNLQDLHGETALILAATRSHETVVELLLDKSDVSLQNNKGDTALMLAARAGSEAVVKLLFDERIANMQNKKGRTLLMVAAKAGHEAVIKLLLGQSNVSVNLQDLRGETALILAATRSHETVVELLLDKSDVNLQNNMGETALMHAAKWGRATRVKLRLDKSDVNLQNMGETILMHAARRSHEAFFKRILEKSDVNLQNNNGETALMLAARWGHEAEVKLLLDKSDVNLQNNGDTALMLAARWGHEAEIKLLLDKSDVNLQNNGGETALMIAETYNEAEIVDLLLTKPCKWVSAPERAVFSKDKQREHGSRDIVAWEA